MPRLTKTLVEAAIPAGKEAYLWDSEIRGFGLKVLPSGKRVYLVQYRPKGSARTRRFTLGPHSQALTTDKARGQAAQLMARVALGEDPVQTLQQARVDEAAANAAAQAAATRVETELFTTVVVEFIEKHAKRSNKRWDEAQRILNSSDLDVWKERAISSITKRDVRDLIDEVTERSEGAARLLFAHLRKLFNWCVERLYLETSPFAGLKSPKLRPPRDRVLSDQEITDVWKACASLTPRSARSFDCCC